MSLPDFSLWDTVLSDTHHDRPCLLLDLDCYRQNLATARDMISPGIRPRIVAKSLASLPMLDMAMAGLDAIGVMVFSAGMVSTLLNERPGWEQLLGKPLPIAAVEKILSDMPLAAEQVIWLIDTAVRAEQMAALSRAKGLRLRVALEIDLGLHRGGTEPREIETRLRGLHAEPAFTLEGVMGYEPHLAKLPGLLRPMAEKKVRRVLRHAAETLKELGAGTMVNTGGSLTFGRYQSDQGVSEVSLGSALSKPTDFDIPATTRFRPALFIATPILKYMPGNPLPGLDQIARLTRLIKPAHLAIYGGYWKARPVHPAGYSYSGIFGRSSNQEVWSGPRLAATPIDHFAYLRPTQSEAVIPEFQDITLIESGQLMGHWPAMATF